MLRRGQLLPQHREHHELDKAMSVLAAVDAELFKGYKAARALLDSAGGKAKKGKVG